MGGQVGGRVNEAAGRVWVGRLGRVRRAARPVDCLASSSSDMPANAPVLLAALLRA